MSYARRAAQRDLRRVFPPAMYSFFALFPLLVGFTGPPLKRQEVAKVLVSSGFSSGSVVCKALGALPSAISPRGGTDGGEMSVAVFPGRTIWPTWAPVRTPPPLLGRWCYARAALGPGSLS
jgi:hypothetical protein